MIARKGNKIGMDGRTRRDIRVFPKIDAKARLLHTREKCLWPGKTPTIPHVAGGIACALPAGFQTNHIAGDPLPPVVHRLLKSLLIRRIALDAMPETQSPARR